MNILIISENFLKGGLETHIATLYNELKKDNNIYFCFSNYDSDLIDNRDLIYSDFSFTPNSTILDFYNDVNKLVEIIENKKIELIIVHPFYSLFPAIIAAHLTNTKIVYVYHGNASLSFPNNINDLILFRYAFESTIGKVLSVSYQGIKAFETINFKDTIFLPNPIDDKYFKTSEVQLNKSWVLISRLDIDKVNDIINILDILPKLDIGSLDIYGDGTEVDSIKKYIKENNLDKKVFLKGFTHDINQIIANKYTGVIGLGRVALEGLSMNYPVLLTGYGKVVGVINQDIYNSVYKYNFVPKYCNSLEFKEIQKQIMEINNGNISDYQFRDKIKKDFGVKQYITLLNKEVKSIKFYSLENIKKFYKGIEQLKSSDNKNENFYISENIFKLLKTDIIPHTNDYNLKTDFVLLEHQLKNNEMINETKRLIELCESYQNKIEDIHNSTSWKITLPIRVLKNRIMKLKKDLNK